jgi:hypothetical protein
MHAVPGTYIHIYMYMNLEQHPAAAAAAAAVIQVDSTHTADTAASSVCTRRENASSSPPRPIVV